MLKNLGGAKEAAAGNGWSQSMAEAPTFDVPKTFEIKKPSCSHPGYTKLAVEEGKPFYLVAKASASCASIELMNANGGAADTAGNSIEVCAKNGPQTITSRGQAGGTYLGVAERYGCTGITVSLEAKAGDAPAGGAAPAAAPGNLGVPPPSPNEPTEPPTM